MVGFCIPFYVVSLLSVIFELVCHFIQHVMSTLGYTTVTCSFLYTTRKLQSLHPFVQYFGLLCLKSSIIFIIILLVVVYICVVNILLIIHFWFDWVG